MTIAALHPPAAFDWRRRALFDTAAAPVYAVLALEACVIAVAVAGGWFTADPGLFHATLGEGGAIAAFAWAVRWSGFPRLATYVEILALSMIGAVLTMSCSLVLAATGLPLADQLLAAVDRTVFGFDRRALAAALHDWPRVLRASNWVYNSAAISVQLLIVGLLWRHGTRATWRLAAALQLATVVGLIVFPLFPAFGTPPYSYRFEDVLTGVRGGSIRAIDAQALTGLITFPSMHAAGGALFAWGFLKLGRGALPLVGLNILVVGSAITSGGHYLVDVVAGLAVACVAARAAGRRVPDPPPPATAGRQAGA